MKKLIVFLSVVCCAATALGQTLEDAVAAQTQAQMAQMSTTMAINAWGTALEALGDAEDGINAPGYPFWGTCQSCTGNQTVYNAQKALGDFLSANYNDAMSKSNAGDAAMTAGELSIAAGNTAYSLAQYPLAIASYLAAQGSYAVAEGQFSLAATAFNNMSGHLFNATMAIQMITMCGECNCALCQVMPCACCDICWSYPCICAWCPACYMNPCICPCPMCLMSPCMCP